MIADTVNSLAFLLIAPWAGLSFVGGVIAARLWERAKRRIDDQETDQ